MGQTPFSTRLLARNPEAPGSEAFHQTLLDNGLRVLVESCPIPHSAAAALWFEAGSRHDGPGSDGLAHLVEHVIFRRTEALGQFGVELESLGADIDATTERELTGFSVRSLREDLPQALQLLRNLVTAPSFGQEEVEKERRVVEQEIALQQADSEAHVQDLLAGRLFAGSPLAHPITGDPGTIGRLGLDDVHRFMAHRYRTSLATLVLAGDLDPQRAAATADDAFASWKAPPQPGGAGPAGPGVPRHPAAAHIFEPRAHDQVHICAGVEGLARNDPDRVALYALSALLGEGMSSRLFLRAREREAMTYSIYSYYNLYQETGSLAICAATRPEAYTDAVHLVAEECRRIAAETVAEGELTLARAKLRRNLRFNMERVELRATRVVKEAVWNDRYFTLPELEDMIQAVTPAAVQRVAQRLFMADRMVVAGLGPLDQARPDAVRLSSGAGLELLPA